MTARSRLRLGAALLASAGLAAGLGVSTSAAAGDTPSAQAGNGKVAKMARGRPFCPPRTVCLYPHPNFKGTQRRYHCGRENEYKVAYLSRLFPWNRAGGVSSYQNARGAENAVMTFHPRDGGVFSVRLAQNFGGNLGSRSDNLATKLELTC